MLGKSCALLPMYQFMMAKEMLEIHWGIELVEYDGDDVCCNIYDQAVTTCGWGSVDL
jgi:hypothetical protein